MSQERDYGDEHPEPPGLFGINATGLWSGRRRKPPTYDEACAALEANFRRGADRPRPTLMSAENIAALEAMLREP